MRRTIKVAKAHDSSTHVHSRYRYQNDSQRARAHTHAHLQGRCISMKCITVKPESALRWTPPLAALAAHKHKRSVQGHQMQTFTAIICGRDKSSPSAAHNAWWSMLTAGVDANTSDAALTALTAWAAACCGCCCLAA